MGASRIAGWPRLIRCWRALKTSSRMTRVLLIRHGETPWNRDRRWQGHADVALSEEGQAQARRLAAYLKDRGMPIAAVYSSDLRRARDTAFEIAEALATKLVVDATWREIEVGRWTGLSREEIKERFADEWTRLAAGEDLSRGGGERFADFSRRVVAALEGLRARHAEQTVAVVTHGGVISAVLLHVLGLSWSRLREVGAVANTALNELLWTEGAWTITARNQAPHLEAPIWGSLQ